jgi:hypothetical protein
MELGRNDDSVGGQLLRQDDDGTWTRYFYDGLNVLLERESPYAPSTWGAFVGEDAEDGDASEWWTWSSTTITNAWDSARRSRVIQTDHPTAGAASMVESRSSVDSRCLERASRPWARASVQGFGLPLAEFLNGLISQGAEPVL